MKKLTDLAEPLRDLDGNAVVDAGRTVTVGSVLANTLMRSQQADAIHADELARKIYHAEEIEIEDGDAEMLRKAVESDQLLTVLGKAAVLKVLA